MAVLLRSEVTPGQIRRVLKAYALPQYRLAVLLGCSPATMWRIIAGKIEPTMDQAALLEALHLVAKERPTTTRRIAKALVSSGRLPALSLLLRTSHLK